MNTLKRFLNTAYQRTMDYCFNLRLQRNQQVILKNKTKGIFAVEVFSKMGFGANFIWMLEILEYCDSESLKPFVTFRNPSKRIGAKSFSELVKFKHDSKKPFFLHYAVMHSFKDLGLTKTWNYNSAMTLDRANYLVNKYLIIDNGVTEFVLDYFNNHFNGDLIFGVHYRGTDKINEAPAVSYEQVNEILQAEIKKDSKNLRFFIASDDHGFINYITGQLGEEKVLFRTINRSKNDKPIHITAKNYREVNREALIDCLILSKCDKLIKTASILSGCSVIFNPDLEVEMLNEPYPNYRFFPEKLFLK